MKQLRFSGMSKLTPGCPAGICSSWSQGAVGINGLRASGSRKRDALYKAGHSPGARLSLEGCVYVSA